MSFGRLFLGGLPPGAEVLIAGLRWFQVEFDDAGIDQAARGVQQHVPVIQTAPAVAAEIAPLAGLSDCNIIPVVGLICNRVGFGRVWWVVIGSAAALVWRRN